VKIRIHLATLALVLAGSACLAATSLLLPLLSAQQSATQATSSPASPQAGTQSAPSAEQNGGYKIAVGVEVVLVPVVVRDAQGRAVGGLTKDDFEIVDGGKSRAISGFTIERRAVSASESESARSAPAPSVDLAAARAGAAALAPKPSPAASAPRCTVLLFDDLHLSEGDLARTQAVGTRMLAAPLGAREAVAVVSMSGSNSGLLQDPAKLRDAVAKLHVTNLYRKIGPECPDIGYLEADRLQNKRDNAALETAVANYLACSNSIGLTPEIARRQVLGAATRTLEMGDQDTRVSLSFLAGVVKRMSTLPGQRTLVLVSPGFLTITAESQAEKSIILNMAAQANVTISALDARGLYTTEIDASERGAQSQLALMKGSDQEYHRESAEGAGNVLGELADGTGGSYFHNSNDLFGGLQHLVAGPEYLYVLEFSLDDVKRDGAYHPLKVKVNRPGLKLQARHGYFAPKPAKKEK
jgi:VWFA-related protein